MSHFVFALTNLEAEVLLKSELASDFKDFHPSYSRAGFLTLKATRGQEFFPIMARLTGLCLGKKSFSDLMSLEKAWVWKRDENFFMPPELKALSDRTIFKIGEIAKLIMIINPEEYWLGEYVLKRTHFQTPGEVTSIEKRQVPSRAYYKIAEAFEAFDLPFDQQEKVLELGSAPGGASLFLLEQDMIVYGVDPAEMDPQVKKHINFKHIQKPFETITGKNIDPDIDWIVSDINLPPTVILKEVERLLSFLNPRGLVLTLKLNQDRYLKMLKLIKERIKELGFERVEFKYLPSHRQEVVLIAMHS
jgi:predicted rRNA methylase YqxC with S4 and FtsJ domains